MEMPWRSMSLSPFLLESPAVVAFSGGRTSGLMLHEILHAHKEEGRPGPHVVFCNTGKERVETLDFVHDVERRWDVAITWLEYRWEPGRHFYERVDYDTASRDGRPFEDAIRAREYLPNRVSRFCTSELKVKTMWRWARDTGLDAYTKAIGLRYDEPGRVKKVLACGGAADDSEPVMFPGETATQAARRLRQEVRVSERKVCPLFDAGATLHHVSEFWRLQRCGMDLAPWLELPRDRRRGWDLALHPHEGNCDLCFLKRKSSVLEIMGRRPDLAAWWAGQEQGAKFFRSINDRPRYATLLEQARQPSLFPMVDEEDDIPCACTD